MEIGIVRITMRDNKVFVTVKDKDRKLICHMQEMKYYYHAQTLDSHEILIRDK